MRQEKAFNLFIFLSMFARSLIEVFIPLILYKQGLPVTGIILFLLFNFIFSFLMTIPLTYIAIKISFKWLMVISSFFVGIAYYFLFLKEPTVINLMVIIVSHVINAHTYWLARHYYALRILPRSNMGDEVGNMVILTQLALIPASFLGALLMNHIAIEYFLVMVVILYIIGVWPLFKIKSYHHQAVPFFKTLKQTFIDIPKQSRYFFAFAQFRIVSRYLFPLYIFISIEQRYEYIGIFNIVVGIASMFFVYMFSRKIDRDKKDYLILSGFLSCVIWILKLNVATTLLMLIVGLGEGLVEKMYETSFNRNLYALGKHYHPLYYGAVIEGFQHLIRVLIMFFVWLFVKDLTIALYITAFMLMVTGIIGFDDGKGGY